MTIVLQMCIIIAQVCDWLQTRYISTHPHIFFELNPILGCHPTLRQVNWYFAVCIVGSILITVFIKRDYRLLWQILNFVVQLGFVIHNWRIGVKYA